LSKAKKQDDFFTQLNKEEKMPTVIGQPASSSSSATTTSHVEAKTNHPHVHIEEQLLVALDKEGTLKKLEIKGEIKLMCYDPDEAKITLKTNGAGKESDGLKFRLHPKINKKLWTKDGTLGLNDSSKPFPCGADNAPIILKWRQTSKEESQLPFTLNFWPNVEDQQSVVSAEFNAEKEGFICQNVTITIPCRSSEPPEIKQITGDFKYDPKQKLLIWTIPEISPDKPNGNLEFVVPELDADEFYPISINFKSSVLYSDIKIDSIVKVGTEETVEFKTTQGLVVEKYQIGGVVPASD